MKQRIFHFGTGGNQSSEGLHVSDNANAVFSSLKKKKSLKILKTLSCISGKFSCLLVLSIFIFMAAGCKEKIDLPTSSSTFLKVEYGGCNNLTMEENSQRTRKENQNDTIIFDFQNDTLIITVGVNYTCCAKFNADQNVKGSVISLIINDTTASPDEYCRCQCDYIFEYYFTNLSQMSYEVNAIIQSPDSSVYKLISQTFNKN